MWIELFQKRMGLWHIHKHVTKHWFNIQCEACFFCNFEEPSTSVWFDCAYFKLIYNISSFFSFKFYVKFFVRCFLSLGVWKKMLTWNTVTVAHKMLLKCFRSHSQCGCLLIISGQVHSLSCPVDSSVNLQNLPPNRYMPSMLLYIVIYVFLVMIIIILILLKIFCTFFFWL